MQITVHLFGRLTDITGKEPILVEDVADTDQLIRELNLIYPGLANAVYTIAVDCNLISGNTHLHNQDTIALLPQYSGG